MDNNQINDTVILRIKRILQLFFVTSTKNKGETLKVVGFARHMPSDQSFICKQNCGMTSIHSAGNFVDQEMNCAGQKGFKFYHDQGIMAKWTSVVIKSLPMLTSYDTDIVHQILRCGQDVLIAHPSILMRSTNQARIICICVLHTLNESLQENPTKILSGLVGERVWACING